MDRPLGLRLDVWSKQLSVKQPLTLKSHPVGDFFVFLRIDFENWGL